LNKLPRNNLQTMTKDNNGRGKLVPYGKIQQRLQKMQIYCSKKL
jgi:hypothetical protein